MDTAATEKAKEASAKARSTPLEQFDVADPELFRNDTLWPWFERLRREDPVHLCRESRFGPYWSVTKHHDIIAVDSNHRVFSSDSEIGGITIMDGFQPRQQSSFIALDPPMHDAQRKVIMPMFTPESLATLAPLIRSRAAKILDELPRGETFDFVDRVAVELTSQMLATLFDFPFDDRRVLPRCSDLILAQPEPGGVVESEEQRQVELFQIFWASSSASGTNKSRYRPRTIWSRCLRTPTRRGATRRRTISATSSCSSSPAATRRVTRLLAAFSRCTRIPSNMTNCAPIDR